jgi:hypothetical protein
MPTITLPSRCDRAAAEAVLPAMIASLGSGPLHIDARECTQIGQAMLQLLVSARRSQGGATILPRPSCRTSPAWRACKPTCSMEARHDQRGNPGDLLRGMRGIAGRRRNRAGRLPAGTQDDDTVNAVFRGVHSIKGGAGAFGFIALQAFTHTFETLLSDVRDGTVPLTEPLIELCCARSIR